jgi:hypothetical protein
MIFAYCLADYCIGGGVGCSSCGGYDLMVVVDVLVFVVLLVLGGEQWLT